MPNLSFTLLDEDLDILESTKSFTIYDVQTKEKKVDSEIDLEIIKTAMGPLASQIKIEAQKEGLDPDYYKIQYYLVLATEEEEVNSLGYIEHEDAMLTASSELGKAEVNGFKNKYKVYLQGVCV